ncbi:MAG: PIG-L family deacetylase [Acidobacteria bacterium]|nr:PIG-L family deacetylase [Acidobacteriota bacterium]
MTILVSFAHPDDECFFLAGTIRKYAEAGHRIVLVSATSGEAGTVGDPPLCSREELGRVRDGELKAAAALLGIAELHLLGYPDRGLAGVQPAEIREKLVALLRRYRPSVVVGFDPNGVNAHPDHIASGRFTTDAVVAAADPRWHPEHGGAHQPARVVWTTPVRPYFMGTTENLAEHPGIDFLFDVRPWVRAKAEALLAHATQRKSVNRHFFDNEDWERRMSVEALRLAGGRAPARRPARDLFEDLV